MGFGRSPWFAEGVHSEKFEQVKLAAILKSPF